MSGARPVVCSMRSSVISIDVEVAQAEEVHLQEPEVLDAVHLVLRDDRRVFERRARLGLALDRQVLGERLARDDDRGGVDAVLAAQPFEPAWRRRSRGGRRDRRRTASRSSVAIL